MVYAGATKAPDWVSAALKRRVALPPRLKPQKIFTRKILRNKKTENKKIRRKMEEAGAQKEARARKIFDFAVTALIAGVLLLGLASGNLQKYAQSNFYPGLQFAGQNSGSGANSDSGTKPASRTNSGSSGQDSGSASSAAYIRQAAAAVLPSVVSVNVMEKVYAPVALNYPLAFDVNMPEPQVDQAAAEKIAAGSGFFISSGGYILTNNHVVDNPNAYYTVTLPGAGAPTLNAQVVARDSAHDLAIIKISGDGYAPVAFGNTSDLNVGEQVAGIGNALGRFPGTVSEGAVIALDKQIIATGENSSEQLNGLIETDAGMYPGDSGGPLLDADGKVVGVDVAIDENTGTSFSIPASVAENFIGQAQASGAVRP